MTPLSAGWAGNPQGLPEGFHEIGTPAPNDETPVSPDSRPEEHVTPAELAADEAAAADAEAKLAADAEALAEIEDADAPAPAANPIEQAIQSAAAHRRI